MHATTEHAPSELPRAHKTLASGRGRDSEWLCLLVLSALLTACSPRQLLVQGVAGALASQGQMEEEDLGLARDAAPFYLKLSESLFKESPDHL